MQLAIADDGFTEAARDRAIELLNLGDPEENEVKRPPQLKPDEWDIWEQTFENNLKSLRGVEGTPLHYIIRDENKGPDDFPATDEENRRLYSVRLNGVVFRQDNTLVAQVLFSLIANTGADAFVDEHSNNGRRMMTQLRAHYNGPGEVNKRYKKAEQ